MEIKYYPTKNYQLIIIYHLGALENSIHIIGDEKSKKAAVVDPAWDSDLFIKLSSEHGYKITQIYITHWHPDHTNKVDDLALKTQATVYASIDELPYLQHIQTHINPLYDNDIIDLGNTKIKAISTPGHSKGGMSYLLDNRLIAGDSLFVYGTGHCALAGSDVTQLYQTMQKFKQLDDDIQLHCGHDYGCVKTTTMGEQKKGNPFLLIDNLDDFIRYRQDIHDQTRSYPMKKMTKEEVLSLL